MMSFFENLKKHLAPVKAGRDENTWIIYPATSGASVQCGPGMHGTQCRQGVHALIVNASFEKTQEENFEDATGHYARYP